MIATIETIADVKKFARDLVKEGLGAGFHPDSDFEEYGHTDDKTDRWVEMYTPEEAEIRNELLHQAWEVCAFNGADIYGIMSEITQANLR